jgi:hypothetical protein
MNEPSGRPTERSWDDERLGEAYRAMAARPAPLDLRDAVLAATRPEPRRQGRGPRTLEWLTLRRPRAAIAGSVFVLGVTAILVAGLAIRATPAASPGGTSAIGAPTTVDGLTVQTVSAALAAEPSGSDGLVVIEGWIIPMPIPAGCKPEITAGPALEKSCTARRLLVTETRQDLATNPLASPYLYASEFSGANVDSLLPDMADPAQANRVPLRAVIVGHFHDARATECSAEQRADCESTFVVDRLAWLDGKSLGPSMWIGGDSTGAELKPRLSADAVISALRPSLDASDEVVSIAAVSLVDITSITGKGTQATGNGADILWFVRIAGPAPRYPAMGWGAGNSGWMVLDDASGKLRGAGGWGFVSAIASSYSPSPGPPPPDGLYSLPTVNWLARGTCAGVGLDAVLRGSPSDPRVAWLENRTGAATRRDVTWPAGYHARFSPNIEILDENGNVVLRDGEAVEGACGYNPDTGWIYLEPPFR